MRQDMSKLICERPRVGGRGWGRENDERGAYSRAHSKRVVLDVIDDSEFDIMEIESIDDVRSDDIAGERYHQRRVRQITPVPADIDESPRRARRGFVSLHRTGKEFSDFLSPLRGWLRKQAGRPWDKVYSELCDALPDGVMGRHVRTHVDRYVIQHVIIIDGRAHENDVYRDEISKNDLYVHPIDGLLKWGKGESGFSSGLRGVTPRRGNINVKPTRTDIVQLNDGTQLHQRAGLWYHATARPGGLPVETWELGYYARCAGSLPDRSWNKMALGHDGQKYMTSQYFIYKTLSKRELKMYGVKNAPQEETKK